MGVPAFFRWLSRKYPSVIVFCQEEKPVSLNGHTIPVDGSQPNPNGVEFDNLYLDMNGIIHPCTHPEDRPAPRDEDEMMIAIFQCIDRLMSIVRPRKLLYMAIDGVAPRAKMNQQRSRRFRASKETAEKAAEIARRREELLQKGAFLPPPRVSEGDHFDSNCITPGTPFMDRLAKALHYYIHDRLTNDPGWKGIKVVLSDANVPGEGEHKIMDYIRKQRAQPDHDPNTQHVLCGADADLIMLGLATHEPNFTIIREEFRPNKPRPCDLCFQSGHEMKDCVGCPKPIDGSEVPVPVFGEMVPFIFVRLSVLREYLERELTMPGLSFTYDFERAVDDWVFMCFFVGNDFLPHLPSLEIREGAIDRLINLYKSAVYKTGGFVTDSGLVNLSRVQIILSELGKVEDEIFKKRQQNEIMFRQREKNKKRQAMADSGSNRPAWVPQGQFAPQALGEEVGNGSQIITQPRQEAARGRLAAMSYSNQTEANSNPTSRRKRHHDQSFGDEDEEDPDAHDEVRLWEDGFKDRYYESKFDVSCNNTIFRIHVGHEYVRGLCWVLRYYYQGCASWKWYFPYHYAPFASDFVNIADIDIKFDYNTKPFEPLQQLMSVFPAASSGHVPAPWAQLMHDPYSQIIDFYPVDFKIDLNGKKFAWQGVALLPFVDETRLFRALSPLYDALTPDEARRNRLGGDRMYTSPHSDVHDFLMGLDSTILVEGKVQLCGGTIRGEISSCGTWRVPVGGDLSSPVRGLPALRANRIICVTFSDPVYPSGYIFPAIKLKGVVPPARILKPSDLTAMESRQWRPQLGMTRATSRAELSMEGTRQVSFYTSAADYHNRILTSVGRPAPRRMPGPYSLVPPRYVYDRRRFNEQISRQNFYNTQEYSPNAYLNFFDDGNNRPMDDDDRRSHRRRRYEPDNRPRRDPSTDFYFPRRTQR